MQELTFIDKSDWEEGAWKSEPDKAYWVDEETGLDCLIKRAHPSGALCGYVGIKEDHPYYGIGYDALETHVDIEVHGGLTYSDHCQDDNKEQGICHIREDGDEDKVWWFGFDCAHVYDKMPGMESLMSRLEREASISDEKAKFSLNALRTTGIFHSTYKDREYVKNQVESLAKQLMSLSVDQSKKSIEQQKTFLNALRRIRERLVKKDNADGVIVESLDEVISHHSTLLEVLEEKEPCNQTQIE